MERHLKKFDTYEEYYVFIQSASTKLPNVSLIGDYWGASSDDYDVEYNRNVEEEYFWIYAYNEGTVAFSIPALNPTANLPWIEYSKNGGATWTRVDNVDEEIVQYSINVEGGDKVMFRAECVSGTSWNVDSTHLYYLSFNTSTAKMAVGGNIASLIYGSDFKGKTTLKNGHPWPFFQLFANSHTLLSARELYLPFGAGNQGTYQRMFQGCDKLVRGPKRLPAKTVSANTYAYMFSMCDSLTDMPEIEATTVGNASFLQMFSGCTSLTGVTDFKMTSAKKDNVFKQMFAGCISLKSAATLNLTSIGNSACSLMYEGCISLEVAKSPNVCSGYSHNKMFADCTGLVNAPSLTATTLRTACYYGMFSGCTSLTNVPTLPAVTLAGLCYGHMFIGCSSLVIAPSMVVNTFAASACSGMFANCVALYDASNEVFNSPSSNNALRCTYTGCISLKYAPTINAGNLGISSMQSTFYNCSALTDVGYIVVSGSVGASGLLTTFFACNSLVNVPSITVTDTTGGKACSGTFKSCVNIVNASSVVIKNMTGTYACYEMFRGCTKLKTGATLNALTISSYSYQNLYYGCSVLEYIKAMFTTTPSDTYTKNWVYGVPTGSTGTFVKNSAAEWANTFGVSAIPNGWTVQTAAA